MADIIIIKDFDDPRLDPYARLSEAQLMTDDGGRDSLFLAESPKVIERALAAGYEPVSALIEDKHIETQSRAVLALLGKVPVFTAPFDVLTGITGYKLTRGMLCLMKRKTLLPADEILAGKSRVAVLENIMNPTNVGAVFRSAAALGMDAVLLSGGCSDPLYRRSARVSMGTVFQVPWTFYGDGISVTDLLRENGFTVVSFALTGNDTDITSPALHRAEKLALIFGNEGDGLKKETVESSDYTVRIPMYNGVDSLNIAAASAVAFWELGKK